MVRYSLGLVFRVRISFKVSFLYYISYIYIC